jgi:hypothetical protein
MTGWSVAPYTFPDTAGLGRRPGIAVSYAGGLQDVRAVRIQVREAFGSAHTVWDSGQTDYDIADADPVTRAITWAGILPNTNYEARGILMPKDGSGRDTSWSSWLAVTTPDVGFSLDDFGIDITAWQAELAASVREAKESIQSIEAAFANIQADTLGNIAQLRTDLAVAFSDNSAKWSNEVQVFAGPNSSAVLRQEIIQAQLDASTVAINASLGVSAATLDGATTLLAAAVTSLQATIPGLATVSALSALTATVTTNTSNIAGNTSDIATNTSNITISAAAITALQGQLGNTGASAIFSMNVGYTPSAGWTSAAAILTSVTAGGAASTAGIVFEAKTGSSRTVLIGDSVVVQNGGTVAAVFKAGAAFLNAAMIENASILSAKIGNLEVKTANIDTLSVTTAKIGNNAVTTADFAFTAANASFTTETTIQTLSFTPANGVVLVKMSCGLSMSIAESVTLRLKRAGVLVSAQVYAMRADVDISGVLSYIDTSPGTSAISWTLTVQRGSTGTGTANQRYIECVNLVK